MSIAQFEDFKSRADEVRSFIERVVARAPSIGEAAMDRAAAVLFIYNLMEAGARGVGEAIFDAVNVQGIEFDDLAMPLKRELYDLLRVRNSVKAAREIKRINRDIYDFAYDPKAVMSGNVDRRKWSERLQDLGCPGSLPADPDGLLVRVKSMRNALAHGHVGFAEGGRDFSVADIQEAYSLAFQMGCKAFEEVKQLIVTGGLKTTES